MVISGIVMLDKDIAPLSLVMTNLSLYIVDECSVPRSYIKSLMRVVVARPAKIGFVHIPMWTMP